MHSIISEGDATVLVGVLTLIGTLATVIGVQVKVHRDNRRDHGETAQRIEVLTVTVEKVADKVDDLNERVSTHLEWHVDHPSQQPQAGE